MNNQPPPGVGPALSALIEQWRKRVAVCRRIAGEVSDQCALAQAWVEEADRVERCADELEAALSGSVGGLNAAPPWQLCELVEELVGWWHLNRDGSVNRTYDYLDKMTKKLRDALPASPVCAAETQEAPETLDPLQGLKTAKYLNPACAADGCQWLRAKS